MQFKGLLYYSYVNIRYSLIIFWLILCSILLLSLGAQFIFSAEEMSFYFSFSAPIYVFAAIMGHWLVKNVLPYSIKMGSDRLNLYIGSGILFLGISIFNAIVANTINSLLNSFNNNMGHMMEFTLDNGEDVKAVHLNHIADLLSKNDWLHRVIIDTSISFFFIAISFIIGLMFYRYRLVGGFAFLGGLLLLFILAVSKGYVWEFAQHMYYNFSFAFFYQLFGVGIIIYLLSYLLLRRLTV